MNKKRLLTVMGGLPYGAALINSGGVITCGSDAALDDLHAGSFTVDAQFKITSSAERVLVQKGNGTGWLLSVNASGTYSVVIYCLTTNALYQFKHASMTDGEWHFIRVIYNNTGDRIPYTFIDGVLIEAGVNFLAREGVGDIKSDATTNLLIGNNVALSRNADMIRMVRVSNTIRDGGVNYSPIETPEVVDANTIGQWNLNTRRADNAEGTATRDGVITNVKWIKYTPT